MIGTSGLFVGLRITIPSALAVLPVRSQHDTLNYSTLGNRPFHVTMDGKVGQETYSRIEATGNELQLLLLLNRSVPAFLEKVMGPGILTAVNHHLRMTANIDFFSTASDPSSVERGLKEIFGRGAGIIIEQCILGAFRSVGLVPDRDFDSIEAAIKEIKRRQSFQL
ncbi:MAG: hypothetical protein ACREAW_07690 [Nitrososphaera sp.]